MNADIRYITAHPGRYALMNLALEPDNYLMVEVDAEGTIHQLTPQDQHDGVLSAAGFHPSVRAYVASASGKTFVRVPV